MRRVIVRLLLLVLAGLLASYLAMAATARRVISFGEYTIYSNAIVRATVGHADEAGGLRALAYARAALSEPALTTQLSSASTQVTIPLPPHTIRQPNPASGPDSYISFATDEEMRIYLTQTMPQAGWAYVDQMGGGHIFSSGARVVALSERYLLSRAIRSLTISVGLSQRVCERRLSMCARAKVQARIHDALAVWRTTPRQPYRSRVCVRPGSRAALDTTRRLDTDVSGLSIVSLFIG